MAGDWGRVLANLNDGITKNMLCARADKTDAWQVGKRVWSRRAAALQGGTMQAWHCRGRALTGARITGTEGVAPFHSNKINIHSNKINTESPQQNILNDSWLQVGYMICK